MSDKPKAATKTEVYAALAEKTGLTKKQIGERDGRADRVHQGQMGKKGPGLFVCRACLKVKRHMKPKQAERMGRNPKTGEEMEIPAKPARTVVKVLALKNLKEMVK